MAESAVTRLDEAPRVVPTRFGGLQAAPAMPAAVPPGPYGRHLLNASAEHIEAVICRVWPGGRDAERRRTRGARILLQHLDGFPGRSWRQRWEASGLNESGRPVNVLIPGYEGRKEICTGMACLLGLRVIRPSLRALRSTRFHGYGERFLTAQRDPLLEDFWTRVQDQPVHPMHHTAALFDVAVTLTTQGIALAGLTPEAFLHYVWQSRDQGLNMKARGKQNRGQFAGQLAWPVLHEMGQFAPATPSTVRAAVLAGRRSLEELVDRYEIRHQGIRQLILDYLARRRSELDYSSLDQHARSLAGLSGPRSRPWPRGILTCASTQDSTSSGANRSTPARTARISGMRLNGSCGRCVLSTLTCTAGRSKSPRCGRRGWRPARSPATRCAGSPFTSGAPRNGWTTGPGDASRCSPPSWPTSRTATTTCAFSCSRPRR